MSDYRCDHCSKHHSASGLLWRCPCGGPLSILSRGRFDPRALGSRPPTIWRYREAIGLGRSIEPVTLGEGLTPIVQHEVAGLPARFKLEYLMPTGSFKDRGASVVISQMSAAGVAHAVEDSSGNAGIALSAYAAHAGIQMDVIVPDDVPRPKLAAIAACGGQVVRVPGGRTAASREALARAESGLPFASHVWNPYFLEGTRTFAFEIWEQLDRRLPPRIFFPAGNGTLLAGAFDGFQQLREDGLAESIPRMMAVQAAVCAPLVSGEPVAAPGPTQADGLRIAWPARARRLQDAVRRSGGAVLAVTEDEISRARMALARAGLDVEATSAVALAGALQWCASDPAAAAREMESEGLPLMPLTGWGARAPAAETS